MSDNLGFALADTSRLLRRAFDARAKCMGVTRQQWRLLFTVKRNEGQNQGFIADLMEVEPITLCRMVDRMAEAGLVERRSDPSDRRAWRLYLTDKSHPLIDQLAHCGETVIGQAMHGISPDDQTRLIAMLDTIRANLTLVHNREDEAANG